MDQHGLEHNSTICIYDKLVLPDCACLYYLHVTKHISQTFLDSKGLANNSEVCDYFSDERSMNWLAEEAARRYYNSCGLRPKLVLCTQEGAEFSPDDMVTDLLTNNEQVTQNFYFSGEDGNFLSLNKIRNGFMVVKSNLFCYNKTWILEYMQ